MIPKSLALQSAERTVLWITPVMRAINLAVYPLVIALNAVGNLMLRLVGINRAEGSTRPSLLARGARAHRRRERGGRAAPRRGRPDAARAVRLQRHHRRARRWCRASASPASRSARRPRTSAAPRMVVRHTRYPVFDGDLDHIVGYIHIKELVRARRGRARASPAATRTRFRRCRTPTTLDDVLATFRRHAAPMAVVFDEHGGTAGVITLEDLVLRGRRRHPGGQPPNCRASRPDGKGGFRVEGTVRIDEVGEALGCELEHPDVDSVSGLVLAVLGRLPVVGEAVEYDHVRFEVTKVERHGVGEARVSTSCRTRATAATAVRVKPRQGRWAPCVGPSAVRLRTRERLKATGHRCRQASASLRSRLISTFTLTRAAGAAVASAFAKTRGGRTFCDGDRLLKCDLDDPMWIGPGELATTLLDDHVAIEHGREVRDDGSLDVGHRDVATEQRRRATSRRDR